uniref:Uncharacterized protein n=1 Tax=viral metagenome TaxID=1070528 RepID=A0A6C0E0S6_9ZZZZ
MGFRHILHNIKEYYVLYTIIGLYLLGLFIFVIGLLLEPHVGSNYISTNIKIIKINNTDIYFNFIDTFPCKYCLHTTLTCSLNNLCPSLIIDKIYPYYCDCEKYICGFIKYNYYNTTGFILILFGANVMFISFLISFIKVCKMFLL